MEPKGRISMKLLLHACCGPCSLEPVRVLHEAGHELTIFFSNSNIAPAGEYVHRLDELLAWARAEGIDVVEGAYEPSAWEASAGRVGEAALASANNDVERCALEPGLREARCRACYRMRFEETARFAAEQGFDAIGTTLSVSPYQFTQVIHEELDRAGEAAGVRTVFEDYRPYYDEATRRSRELDMYRQNYCGCRFSDAEAAAERAIRKRERVAARESERVAHAAERAVEEAAQAQRKAEKQAYAEKQAKKRAALKALKQQEKRDSLQ